MLYSTPICTDHHRFTTGKSHTLSNNLMRSSIPTPTAHSSQGFDHHLQSFTNSYSSNGARTSSSQHDRTPSSLSRAAPLVHRPDLPRTVPLEQLMADRSSFRKRDYSTDSHTSSLPSPPSPPTPAPPTPAPPPAPPPQVNFNHLDSLSSNSLTVASAKLLKTM